MKERKKYSKFGKCIWCLGEEPAVAFNNIPHTFPKSLGGSRFGFDICDNCNAYFGKRDPSLKYLMGPELAFKEILNISRYAFPTSEMHKNESIMKSVYFNIYKKQRKFEVKSSFKFSPSFVSNFTRQFIKGVYICFLQEYHYKTGNGLDKCFNDIRNFCRYDIGDLPLYYLDNPGCYLTRKDGEDFNSPELFFNEKILSDINDYGFYITTIFGHKLYLEVTPKSLLSREIYLSKDISFHKNGIFSNGIIKIKSIFDIDFLYNNFNNKEKYYSE